MDNQTYIQALRGVLSEKANKQYNEIMVNVKRYVDQNPDTNLTAHFGTPDQLVNRHLDPDGLEPIVKPVSRIKIWSKRLLYTVIILPWLVILFIAIMASIYADDHFDYADYDGSSVTQIPDIYWYVDNINEAVERIDVEQARAVFYWDLNLDATQIKYSCEREVPLIEAQSIRIRHNDCLVVLPARPVVINAFQSDNVMVAPQANVAIKLKQARLRLAEQGNGYIYQIQQDRSDVKPMNSQVGAAIQLDINATESQVKPYQFE